MGFSSITLKDIAKATGLSTSTVSKALRDSYEISEATKKIIQEYATRHNYRPNPIAKSLKDGKSKAIGVIISTINNNFLSSVIDGIESLAYQKGYHIIICQTHESADREKLHVEHLSSRSIDGLLISLSTETKNTDYLKQLQKQGMPIVFFDRIDREIETHKVTVDNFKGAYEATTHLIKSGFKTIAHITSSLNVSITQERMDGYKKALADNNIPLDNELIKYCEHGGKDLSEIEKAIIELMSAKTKPDAIFGASDRITTRTLKIINKMGLHIPKDIALLGFTNEALADCLKPSLTTIEQPALEIGKQAVELLISLIESKYEVTQFETRVLNTTLEIRDSTGGRV